MKTTGMCGRILFKLLLALMLVIGCCPHSIAAAAPQIRDFSGPRLAGGEHHSLLIKADGSIWGWGENDSGQLGLGTISNRLDPVQVGSASLKAVTAGDRHTIVIHKEGSLWAWGNNEHGQLGQGDRVNRSRPVQVGAASNWVAVSAGSGHVLALEADGSLWAWGDNEYGQLGLGDKVNRLRPVQVGSALNWTAVSAGKAHSLALKADGSLWAWGNNNYGQLGLGNFIQQEEPVQVGSATDWVALSAGGYHNLALKADGGLWAWGWNSQGQLGVEAPNKRRPMQVGSARDWIAITAGKTHSLALKADGTLWAWGWNGQGQLGFEGKDNSIIPAQVDSATDWAAVTAGSYHTLAIKTDGGFWAWGLNDRGQLGLGDISQHFTPGQVEATKHLSLGRDPERYDFGAVPRGSVGVSQSFNLNYNGDLGFAITGMEVRGPFEISDDCPETLAAGSACTVTASIKANMLGKHSGAIVIMSPNTTAGELVINLAATAERPFAPRIEGSGNHSVLQKADGSLWVWGNNSRGQLGLGDYDNRSMPVEVSSGTRWNTVAAREHTLAIKADGSLWAWGLNWHGQLGLGHTEPILIPEQIEAGTDWLAVSAGGWHSLAIRADGSLYAWGRNNYGQLGLGHTEPVTVPQQVGTETDWVAVSTGVWHSLAIKTDGSLHAWGRNNYGQLGLGDTTNRLSPARMNETHWEIVVAGYDHTLAIKVDGTLWSWGDNTFGQLGLGHTEPRHLPERVGEDEDWDTVITGYDHTFGFKADGGLWGWGTNRDGQLGLGEEDGISRSSPVQLGNASDWLTVSTGDHTLALKGDGTLHAWGRNTEGQLGQGDTIVRTIPAQIDAENHIPLLLSTERQDFGVLNRGADGVKQVFTLTNGHESREFQLTGIGVRGPYEARHTCPAILAAGSSCTVIVNLRTNAAGDYRGALAIRSPNVYSGEVTIPIAAGITGPKLKIEHPGHFYAVQVGATVKARVLLTNAGSEPLVIKGITPYGNRAFGVANNCKRTLEPGGSCVLGINFSPYVYGNFAGGVEISTNDPVKPLRKVGFRGTGEGAGISPSDIVRSGELTADEAGVHAVN